MRTSLFSFAIGLALLVPQASGATELAVPMTPETRAKILAEGVPSESLERILNYIALNDGQTIKVDAYECKADSKGKPPTNPDKPCGGSDRERSVREIAFKAPRYVVSIDFGKPSTDKRFYFIDLTTGLVEKYLVAHGKGSGSSKWATRFSNKPDSKMTSLGLYLAGGVYDGKYGATGRLYGLERSNDKAYARDIVFHGAWYAQPDFVTKQNPHTKAAYDRLGVSWGCPAIDPKIERRLLPLIQGTAIFDHYHPTLLQAAQSGGIVEVPAPVGQPVPSESGSDDDDEDSHAAPIPTPTPRPTPLPLPPLPSLAAPATTVIAR